MEDRFSILRYMPYLQQGGPTAQGIASINRRMNDVIPMSTPYSMAPSAGTTYTDLQSMNPEPIDPFLDYQSPGALSSLSTGLQVAQTAPQLLNLKLGKQTLGQQIGVDFSGPGTSIKNPFTQTASTAPNIIPTSSTIVGTGAPVGTQAVFNPTTGAQMSVAPGASIPAGFEAAPAQLTAGQAAGNYFSNLKAGSVSAGVPTYIAGRLIRSAFDDDDPTTFTGGEMAGAAISGAGAASSLMALSPKLAALGPAGIALGIGISLFGGARKRKKARKLQKAYEKALKERESEIREMYQESLTEAREEREGEAQAANYMRTASKFNNPYGMGNFDEGGLTPKEKAKIAKMGRFGDTELAHINKTEEYLLKMLGGAGTINPETGLKEFHFKMPFSKKNRRHNKKHISGALKAAGDFIAPVAQTVQTVVQPIGDVATAAGDVATTATQGVIDTAETVGGGALAAASDVGKLAGGTIDKTVKTFGGDKILKAAGKTVKLAGETAKPFIEAAGEVTAMGIETGIDLAMDSIEFAGGMVQSAIEPIAENIVFPAMETFVKPIAQLVQSGGQQLFDFIQGDDDEPQINLGPIQDPNIQTVETVQDPNIVTIDPYTNKPVEKAFDFSMGSGSAGFIRPEDIEMDNMYKETQESV